MLPLLYKEIYIHLSGKKEKKIHEKILIQLVLLSAAGSHMFLGILSIDVIYDAS
jgi:hypothetical protein